MRFLGLGPGDSVPDAKTIWLLWEHLTQAGVVDNLFARFDKHLTRGRQGSGRVERQARQAAPEGPGRALDGEVLEGQDG